VGITGRSMVRAEQARSGFSPIALQGCVLETAEELSLGKLIDDCSTKYRNTK
jgi:hypothetical protein